MLKILKNKTGATLITVIIITTILLVFGAVLVDVAFQGLTLTKRHRNVDFSNFAAHTAIQNWFSKIDELTEDEGFVSHVKSTNSVTGSIVSEDEINSFAQNIVTEIEVRLSNRQFIDVATIDSLLSEIQGRDPDSVSEVEGFSEVLIEKVELIGAVKVDDDLEVTIGLTVSALFSDGFYTSDNQIVYAQRKFTFKIPENNIFQLEYAILTLGDLFADGQGVGDANNSVVKGDVNVFGTFPSVQGDARQHYYGGIYAIRDARLNLMGNAYTRSFIRTGPYYPRALHNAVPNYDSVYSDGSKIHIYKDAIAQCIQLFGNNSEIAVYRNAYTFVDLEMNAENSILFVNGSFVGLTRGRGKDVPHDNLSAIVNSAPIHNLLSGPSKRSRIVVGGDIIIPGGTMRLNPDDDMRVVGQIEDASVAWWDNPGVWNGPFYRYHDVEGIEDPHAYYNLLKDFYDRREGYIGGISNIFQMSDFSIDVKGFWQNIQRAFYGDSGDNSILISGFLIGINDTLSNIRAHMDSNYKTDFSGGLGNISGAFGFGVAANGRLYSYADDANLNWTNEVDTLQFLTDGSYVLDNIFDEDNNIRFNSSYWEVDIMDNQEYNNSILSKVEIPGGIRDALYERSQPFLVREYTDGEIWDVKMRQNDGDDHDLFNQIMIGIDSRMTLFNDDYFIFFPNDGNNTPYTLEDYVSDGGSYYFIYNKNPQKDIIIDKPFNGIIFSTGKVILENGANVKGSIVTAGGGDWVSSDKFVPRAEFGIDMDDPMIRGRLDSGEHYAGVIFKSGDISVDFYLGLSATVVLQTAANSQGDTNYLRIEMLNKAARWNLLNELKENGINLEQVF
ncbi:UNVERIFIED_CONTAM: hypothetical protein Cloal_4306 [Acetivibrio alkalicellulosi]